MIAEALRGAVDEVMADRLRDPAQREQVVTALMAGFERLQKKPVPDAAQRTERLQDRMRLMAQNIQLGFVNGRLVVKVDGSSESLMKELRRGTDWYVPWDKVDETLLAAVLLDPERK